MLIPSKNVKQTTTKMTRTDGDEMVVCEASCYVDGKPQVNMKV